MVSINEYLNKTLNKTGNLFIAGVESLYALDKEISAKTKLSISNYIEKFSLAFQIKNDIDDFFKGSTDFKNGNYTLPVLYYFLENPNGKIDLKSDDFRKYIDLSNNKLDEITNEALDKLNDIEDSMYKNALVQITLEVLRG